MEPIEFSEIVRRMKEKINEGSKPSIYFDSIPDELRQRLRNVGTKITKRPNTKPSCIVDDWEHPVTSDVRSRAYNPTLNPAKILFSYQTYLRAL